MLNNGYLSLEVINGTNLYVPSERTPAGFHVIVSTPHSQWNTAVKAAMVDHSVPWNETLAMWAQPLMFPRWLMPIFPKKSKAVQLEIRASFEHGCLGRGELLGTFQTTLEELLLHAGKQFEIGLPVISAQCPSLLLKVERSKAPRLPARTASNTQQSSGFHSVIGRITDKAHEAYTLYRRSDNPKYLDSAIQDFQEVLTECPKGHPHRGAALSNLAHAITSGFTKGVRADIDHAISLFRRALEHHHGEHPDHPLSILNLSKALHLRHSMGKNSADLHEAVVLCHSLLPLCLKDSHLHLHAIEQCNALPRNPSDESIMLRRIVLEHCQPRHPHRTRSLNRLARDLYARFEQSGNIDHINEAVQLSREALTSCPADGERSFYLSILSYYILKRFRHFRYTGDIEECISLNREALALCPPGHSAHERSLKYLAKALKARYDEYGNIVDFQEAMQLSRATHDVGSWNSGTLPHPSEYSGVYLDLERGPLTCTPEPEEEQRQPPLKSLMSDHQTQPRARNIVIFGEAGSGKSSVINAITQSHRAETSSSAAGCTFRYQRHGVEISGENFVLYDTVGLDEGTAGTVPAAEAEENLKSLLRELVGSGSNGISLLVYCVRSVRVSRALLRNYNLFYSAICRKKVPVVIVVTGLENQESTMDSWWDTNGMVFKKFGMYFEDHACVTTLRDSPDIPDVFAHRITESRDILRGLILNNCSEYTEHDQR
ncbi:hypothetical protein K503DRAFT_870523 [Rhizopogon vinicolor AM-OR11-026]|uniref:G domain-containing protein n=1 Tax=Rhizopogon vinicolor AM-OR11-026 TaxID=1314800 RepID=A0A1B7MGG2_9AGAM|nr:hypothetical protein K503DRAFT_870523 [Rhizopogon vinicolor AM-OR11-026]